MLKHTGRLFLLVFSHLLFVIYPLSLFASDAGSLYTKAQRCYHASVQNPQKCIRGFEKVVKKYPGTDQARKALFTIGKMSEEKDLEKALQTYNQFLKTYPKDPLADDALYRIAKLRWEKQHDREKAIRALNTVVERYPDGDMKGKAEIDLQQMQKGSEDSVIHTVVIDPGHGGEDLGAKGKLGTREAEVSLQIAKKLAGQLKKMGLKVYLTRTTQKGMSLEERNHFATAKNADLFISIHANANPSPNVSGVQTFYLNNASSQAMEELASRENKVAGKILSTPEKILTTMLQNANTLESRELAHSVQQSLVGRLKRNYSGVKDLHVETAIFQVLDGVRCPSILVETSFITNLTEEKRLRDTRYQWAVAEGMAKGVLHYKTAHGSTAKTSAL